MATRNVQLTQTLLDSSSAPVSGKVITFSQGTGGGPGSGLAASTQVGTATTDTTGTAVLTIAVTSPGDYAFKGVFAGDASFDPLTSVIDSFAVSSKTTGTLTAKLA